MNKPFNRSKINKSTKRSDGGYGPLGYLSYLHGLKEGFSLFDHLALDDRPSGENYPAFSFVSLNYLCAEGVFDKAGRVNSTALLG